MISAIAAVAAISSAVAAYMAYRIAARQALPHPNIGWMSSTSGHRSLDFKVERASGSADWVVASVSIRGNWRRRRLIARGYPLHTDDVDGKAVTTYEASGPWQHRIIFDPPLTEGAIVLHPDTPDCEVKLRITLSTLPSPTVERRIKLKSLRPRR